MFLLRIGFPLMQDSYTLKTAKFALFRVQLALFEDVQCGPCIDEVKVYRSPFYCAQVIHVGAVVLSCWVRIEESPQGCLFRITLFSARQRKASGLTRYS